MLILDSGILLALSLSCGYNFEVWEVEPPCTRVKAKTGDKALTSWWAVKLGRNQQMNKNLKFKTSGSAWLSNSIWVYCSDFLHGTSQKKMWKIGTLFVPNKQISKKLSVDGQSACSLIFRICTNCWSDICRQNFIVQDFFILWQRLMLDCSRGSWLRDCGRECDQPLTWTFWEVPCKKLLQ